MKPSILIILPHYLPGYAAGGPIKSIANLLSALHNEFNFKIITSDRDLGDTRPYSEVLLDRWIEADGGEVFYASPKNFSIGALASLIRSAPFDLIYLNSCFSFRTTIVPLLLRRLGLLKRAPILLAPRGEFSPGALRISYFKKMCYLTFGKVTGLFRDVTWHASSVMEQHDIALIAGKKANIRLAGNLVSASGPQLGAFQHRKSGDPFRIAFLSRISPKKNLDYALEVLARLSIPVSFSIFGPEEDVVYTARCRAIAKTLPNNIQVNWMGPLRPPEVPLTLAAHDLFFLPTHGENFGHVISEALWAGTPVLLSDTTPWRDLINAGVGYDLPLADPEVFAQVILTQATMMPDQIEKQRRAAVTFARTRQSESNGIRAHGQMFQDAIRTIG